MTWVNISLKEFERLRKRRGLKHETNVHGSEFLFRNLKCVALVSRHPTLQERIVVRAEESELKRVKARKTKGKRKGKSGGRKKGVDERGGKARKTVLGSR